MSDSNLNGLFREVVNEIGNAASDRKVIDALRTLNDFVERVECIRDVGELDKESDSIVKYKLACQGLDLLQHSIPAITQLGERCLQIAGVSAVREACKPIVREGTGHDGKPLPPIKSRYFLPEGYDTLAAKAKALVGG